MTIRAAAAMLCAAVLVTGCSSDEPGAQPLPPLPSASPSAVAVPMPSEAAAETPQGAAAFARYYLELMNEAFRTGDASMVKGVSDPGCGGCSNLIGAVEEEPEAGTRVEGGEYRVQFAEAPPVQDGDVIVELRYSLTELRVIGPDGDVLERKPAVAGVDAQMRLLRRSESWLVAGFRDVR